MEEFILKGWKIILLSSLTGIIYCLSFPGFDQWYLVWISFIPLLYVIEKANSSKQVLLAGFVMGFSGNSLGYYWLPYTIHVFGGFNYPLTYLFFFVLISYQALFFSAFSYLVWKSSRLKLRFKDYELKLPLWFVTPSIMVILEFIYPLLFPIYVANTLHPVPLLIQIVDIGGPLLLTFIIMFVNGSIYVITKDYINRRYINKKLIYATFSSIFFLIIYGGIQLAYQNYKNKNSPAIKVGIVQANMGIYEKWRDIDEGLKRHREASYKLKREGVDLIIWPEASYVNHKICGGLHPLKEGELPQFYICITGGCDCPKIYRRKVSEMVAPGLNLPLIVGALARRLGKDRYHDFNSVFIIDDKGNINGFYDKKYLLAFGEYIPFGETFPQLYRYSAHTGRFTPGNLLNPLPFKNWNIAPLICYEDILPFYTRELANKTKPNLLVNLTNDAWFGDSNEPWIHLALAKFRAVEHHLWLIRATNTGVSAIIDSTGKVIKQSGVFVQENIVGYVRMLDSFTVYRIIGDILGSALTFIFAFIFIWSYVEFRKKERIKK